VSFKWGEEGVFFHTQSENSLILIARVAGVARVVHLLLMLVVLLPDGGWFRRSALRPADSRRGCGARCDAAARGHDRCTRAWGISGSARAKPALQVHWELSISQDQRDHDYNNKAFHRQGQRRRQTDREKERETVSQKEILYQVESINTLDSERKIS